MDSDQVKELKAQLDDHDEVVVVDSDGNILPVQDINWDSRNGRVEIMLNMQLTGNA
jgi:sulfur carrier protein ThiS